jgi:transketolase
MTDPVSDLDARAKSIRRRIITLTGTKGVGHTGGSLSMVEVLTVLYFRVMDVDPEKPRAETRDRFILSKGHATPGYYSALAERGFFPEAWLLDEYDELGGRFQGHPDMNKTPGVDMSTGSLGQGLSVGIGMALGTERRGLPSSVFVLMGDGEMQEGQVWEAILFAGLRKVPRLVAIVDNNGLQLTAPTPSILPLSPIREKVAAFGWNVMDCDGHDVRALSETLAEAKRQSAAGPVFVEARTVKGKGISFIEDRVEWHSKAPSKDEMARALKELE